MKPRILQARVVELTGPRQVVIREQRLEAAKLKAGEILAETLYSAISVGTEMAAYLGAPPLRPGRTYPRLVGYCNVAQVLAQGRAVNRCRPGDRILTFQSHRSAFACREDEIIAIIPKGIDLVAASTTYLFHLGYNALLKGGGVPGQHVGVVGLGTLGAATVSLAAAFGGLVYAFSDQPQGRKAALELGAREAFTKTDENAFHTISTLTSGAGLDLVVNTSNSWPDWKLALRLARKQGTVCVLGFPGRNDPIPPFNPLDSQIFYDRQLTLIACGYAPDYDLPAHDLRFTVKRNCAFLLQAIRAGTLPARRLVSSVQPWSRLPKIYERLARRVGTGFTCVLKWK
ncbi:MAG: zinc-binding alcohol dehydrogenase [Chloroflexi bacterium]|nr:zinc-binding alcohol dehydrogenase [Chloroflexota bacterium]